MHIQNSSRAVVLAAGAAALLLGGLAVTAPAQARTFIGIGVGLPLFGPPVYYAPPPVYYAPPPVYYAPAPASTVYTPAPAAAAQNCRPYQTTIQVNGQPQQVSGTACQQPDGTWRTVQ